MQVCLYRRKDSYDLKWIGKDRVPFFCIKDTGRRGWEIGGDMNVLGWRSGRYQDYNVP